MAQLVEWLLLTPEIRSLNPVINKIYLLSTVLKRQKEKKKEAGNSPFKKTLKFYRMTAVRSDLANICRFINPILNICAIHEGLRSFWQNFILSQWGNFHFRKCPNIDEK